VKAALRATEEVVLALEAGEVELLTPIRLRYTGEVIDLTTAYDDQDVPHTEPVKMKRQFIQHHRRPRDLQRPLARGCPFINGLLKKKGVQQLVYYCYLRFGLERTVRAARRTEGTRLHLRHQVRHLHRHRRHAHPRRQAKLVENAEKEVVKVQQQYLDGAITNGERYNKVIAIWSDITEKVADADVQGPREPGQGRRHQPDLRHGRFRRPRIEAADPPAFRHARPDGQAFRRSHRDAHHFQLPRRPHRAAVLHLHARRA
jgi:hypothetical protein